jgi:hypothetical protein
VLLSVVLALGTQLALVGIVVLSSLFKWDVPPLKIPPTNKSVTLRGLTADEFEKNRGVSNGNVRDERKVVKKEEQKKEPPPKPPGQVVDVAPGNKEIDEKAKFAAETDNKVNKETKAKDQTQNYKNAAPKRTSSKQIDSEGVSDATQLSIAGNNGMGNDDRPVKDAEMQSLAMKIPDIKKQNEVALKSPNDKGPGVNVANREEREAMKGNSDRWGLTPGGYKALMEASAGHIGSEGHPNLLPSAAESRARPTLALNAPTCESPTTDTAWTNLPKPASSSPSSPPKTSAKAQV